MKSGEKRARAAPLWVTVTQTLCVNSDILALQDSSHGRVQ